MRKRSNGDRLRGRRRTGRPQRKPKSDRWYLQKPGMAGAGHHVMKVAFGKTKMDYEVILLDHKRADEHQFFPDDQDAGLVSHE